MNSYAMILTAKNESEAFKKASKGAERYGDYNVSSCLNYTAEEQLFDKTAQRMIDMYKGLIKANKELIDKFEDKVPEDDFILNQMKENLIRFDKGLYKYPDEWRIVFFDGTDFEHIDSIEIYENIFKSYNNKDLYMALIDTP
ncbi:MAG: hypothetical protein ACQESN_00855 [Thermotogota bacterium]